MAATVNPMRKIKIAKLLINTCVPPKQNRLDKAASVLKQLTGQTPKISKAKVTIRGFGIRRNEPMATSVTVQGERAHAILENALKVKEFSLPATCFSNTGGFGFGIQEHIDLNIKYDPACGIFGLNFSVVLERPGARVKHRRRCNARVGNKQTVSAEEARQWFKETFDGIVLE